VFRIRFILVSIKPSDPQSRPSDPQSRTCVQILPWANTRLTKLLLNVFEDFQSHVFYLRLSDRTTFLLFCHEKVNVQKQDTEGQKVPVCSGSTSCHSKKCSNKLKCNFRYRYRKKYTGIYMVCWIEADTVGKKRQSYPRHDTLLVIGTVPCVPVPDLSAL